MAEKRIEFTGVDNGLSQMMTRFRRDAHELGTDLLNDARDYATSSEDQVGYLEEQIRLMERRSRLEKQERSYEAQSQYQEDLKGARTQRERKGAQQDYQESLRESGQAFTEESLQTQLMRELIDTIKTTAKEEIAEDKKDVERRIQSVNAQLRAGEAVDPQVALRTKIQEDLLAVPEEEQGNRFAGAMPFMGGMIFRDLMGGMGQLAGASTGAEVITPAAAAAGGVMGALGALGLGSLAGGIGGFFMAETGAEIGAQLGTVAGSAYTRHLQTRGEYQSEQIGLRGVYGFSTNEEAKIPGMTDYGMDKIQTAQLMKTVGQTTLSDYPVMMEQMMDMVAGKKLLGLSDDDILTTLRQGRMIGEQDLDLTYRQVGATNYMMDGSWQDVPELLKNQNALIETLTRVSDDVSRANVLATLANFAAMGFDTTDPRSIGQIQSIHQNLASPKNAFSRAQNYAVLRQMFPDADLFDLQRYEEKGLETPGFFEAVSNDLRMSGSDTFKKLMFKQKFGQTGDVSERLFEGYDPMDRMYGGDLNNAMGFGFGMTQSSKGVNKLNDKDSIRDYTKDMTTQLQQQRAEITNAFIKGGIAGLKKTGQQFSGIISKALLDAADEFSKAIKAATPGTNKKVVPKTNQVQPGVGSIFVNSILETITAFTGEDEE